MVPSSAFVSGRRAAGVTRGRHGGQRAPLAAELPPRLADPPTGGRVAGGGEGDAWLVAPSINLAEAATELHVFDAARVADGPVCTWRAGLILPAGFHGCWAG